MPQYSDKIEVHAAADEVFRFVSDVKNLPRYLPTVHHAAPQKGGRVEVDGEASGHPYHSDGWFKVDADKRTLDWGSDGEHEYHGRLKVRGDGRAEVECTLVFEPDPATRQRMEQGQGGQDAAMRDGLQACLRSIKQICEGGGGKVKSSAEP